MMKLDLTTVKKCIFCKAPIEIPKGKDKIKIGNCSKKCSIAYKVKIERNVPEILGFSYEFLYKNVNFLIVCKDGKTELHDGIKGLVALLDGCYLLQIADIESLTIFK